MEFTLYGNFIKRLAAGIVDIIIVSLSEALLIFLTLYTSVVLYITDVNQSVINLITYCVFYPSYFIFPWLYYSIQEASNKKASLGKIFFGLIVVDLYGSKISFLRATIRFFLKILTLLTLFIGFFIAAFTKQRQALHDLFADTLVVDKNTSFKIIDNEIKIAQ